MCCKEADFDKLNPELYIIIINYNSFDDSFACISSIINSTFKKFKIILADNKSIDDSVLRLKKMFQSIEYIYNEENLGFSGGCNAGIRKAIKLGADHILLLNNDTIVHPDMLNNLMRHIKPDIGIASGKIYYLDDQNKMWYNGGRIDFYRLEGVPLKKSKESFSKSNASSIEVNFISGCFMYLSKRTIEKIGYLDEALFAQYEDIDYCIRAIKKSVKMLYIPDAIIWHKVSASFGTGEAIIKYKPFTYYLKIRNKLILIRRYTNGYKTIVAVFMQLPKYVKYLCGFLFLLRIDELKFSIKGVKDGFSFNSD